MLLRRHGAWSAYTADRGNFPLFPGMDLLTSSSIETSKQTKCFCCVETQFSELNLGITRLTRVPLENKEAKK